jgi:hypothetical protein
MRPLSLKFGDLDLGRGSVELGDMGSIRRTVNVIIALALAALGCGGFVYFYFIAAAWKGWTVISAVMGGVGLYWLLAEYLNWLSTEYLNPNQRRRTEPCPGPQRREALRGADFFKGAFLFVCLPCGGTYMYMLLWCVAATYPPGWLRTSAFVGGQHKTLARAPGR